MKNLITIFKLLLSPFLFLTRFILLSNSDKYAQVSKKRLSASILTFFIFLLASSTQLQAADDYDASLTVSTSPSSSVDAGDELTYTIIVESESSKIESDIEVTSLFDADFSYINFSGTDWSCTKSGQSVICTYSKNVNNNGSSSTLNFTISPTANGTTTSITNDLNITSVGNTDPDTDPTNNQPSITTTVNPITDVSVVKTTSASSINAGAAFSYTLTASNAGPYDADNVILTDTLPSGVLYNGYTASSGWSCNFGSGKLVCSIATLASSANGIITINTIAPPSDGNIINTVSISTDTVDTNATNDQASVTNVISALNVDLAITKTATPNPVNTASILEYTIDVQNNGSDATTGVQITDTLDTSVLFVSVDGGTDWSCSQGSVVLCDYIGNGGILIPTATPASITLQVTTPVTAGSVLNSASVTSNVGDSDISNNEANVTVTVTDGTNIGSDVNLTKYLQFNLFGDIKLIGNANVNFSGTDPNQNYNDNVDMKYVDTDSFSTFNSSSSTLSLADPNYEIIWAGLYWEGHVCSSQNDGTGNGAGTGCDWSNSSYSSFNDANGHLGEVKLRTPNNNSSYMNIIANSLNIIQRSPTNWTYSAFADITGLLADDETGTYTVADIVLTEGLVGNGGNYGGWSILFIYEDPSTGIQYKNVSVFNGFQYISSDGNQVDIDGFITPQSGDVNASIAFFAADGDPVAGGVARMREGTTNTYSAIGDPVNPIASPTTNLFNSTIAEFGVPINTGVTKTYGVDADRVDVSAFMTNDQTDTSFLFDVSTPTGGVDHYSLSMFAFATDLPTPIINDFTKEALIIDANGTTRIASPGEPIYPGSELLYTLTFTNSGDEVATSVEIFDDFDFDGLSEALDLDNFDISKTKLYSGTDTSSTPIANACAFDAADNRVYCQIDTVAIDATYTMQFSVTVADPIDTSLLDINATNTAYSQYKNPNGDTYVILESTPWGDFGGKSNSLNAGVFTALPSGVLVHEAVDAINLNYSYAIDRNITTKIVNNDFQLKLIYLNNLGQNVQFSNSLGFTMPVFLTLCTAGDRLIPDGEPAPEFSNGLYYVNTANPGASNALNLTKAHQNDKIKAAYINWGNIDWDGSGVNCVQKSSTNGNYKGVPQCLNSENKVLQVFPPELYPYIDETCLGNGLTLTGNEVAACNSQAYSGWSPNSSKQIVPDKYDHTYGCLQCLTDASTAFSTCSTDNFAARPDRFILDMDPTTPGYNHYPDLLRSGIDYNLSINALDGANDPTHPTTDYDQYKNNLDINETLYLSTGAIGTNLMDGDVTFSTTDFNITDGVSVAAGTASNDVMGLTFDNVGIVNIRIEDQIWTFVDRDDTPLDCTSTVNSLGVTIEGPAYICGDINTTFIPHHFTLSNVHLNNHAQNNYTYLSNDLNMSAHLDVTISAMNANEGVTSNFRTGSLYYENAMSVGLSVTDWNASLPARHPLDNAEIIHDIPIAQLLGFGGTDANGTHTIPWNESNDTQKIMFNYVRNNNQPVNPFDVNGTDANISVISTYTGTAPEGSADITGTALADQNATFAFGRTKSSKFFYDNVLATSVTTPISVVVYCDTFPTCTELPDSIEIGGKINEPHWWLSFEHNRVTGDGNVTLEKGNVTEGSGPNWDVLPKVVTITSNAVDNTITVSQGAGAVLPLTVEIDLDASPTTDTNSWLIYNPNSPTATPSPFYKVRFIGQGGWTGHGKTGHVVDSNASNEINKRLSW